MSLLHIWLCAAKRREFHRIFQSGRKHNFLNKEKSQKIENFHMKFRENFLFPTSRFKPVLNYWRLRWCRWYSISIGFNIEGSICGQTRLFIYQYNGSKKWQKAWTFISSLSDKKYVDCGNFCRDYRKNISDRVTGKSVFWAPKFREEIICEHIKM